MCEDSSEDRGSQFELKADSSTVELSALNASSELIGIGHNAAAPVVVESGIYKATLAPGHQRWNVSRRCPITRKHIRLSGYGIGSRTTASRVREHIEILDTLSRKKFLPKMEGDS